MKNMNAFFNLSINRHQVAMQNYLEQAVAKRPLPWRASLAGKEWLVVASDNVAVVTGCADWAEAQAIVTYAQESFVFDNSKPR